MADVRSRLLPFYESAAAGFSTTATVFWEESYAESPGGPSRRWHALGALHPFANIDPERGTVRDFGLQGDLRLPNTTPWDDPTHFLGEFHALHLLIQFGSPATPTVVRVNAIDENPETEALETRILDNPIVLGDVLGQARFEDPQWLVMIFLRNISRVMAPQWGWAAAAIAAGATYPGVDR